MSSFYCDMCNEKKDLKELQLKSETVRAELLLCQACSDKDKINTPMIILAAVLFVALAFIPVVVTR